MRNTKQYWRILEKRIQERMMLNSILKKVSNALFGLIVLSLANLLNAYAYAQEEMGEGLAPPPVRTVVESFGVDAITGRPAGFGGMYVSIGTEESGIKRDPGRQRYMHDNHTGTLSEITWGGGGNDPKEMTGLPAGTYIKVDALGVSEIFRQNGSAYVAAKETAGTFSCSGSICTYTLPDGTVSTFNKTLTNGYGHLPGSSPFKNVGLQTKIVKPDGEEITLTYRQVSGYLGDLPSAAVSSLGWMIKYQFGPKSSESISGEGYTGTRVTSSRSVKAINTSIEYCDPVAANCNGLQYTWPESTMDGEGVITWTPLSSSYYSISTTSVVTNELGQSDYHNQSHHTSGAVEGSISYTSPGSLQYTYHIGACQYSSQYGCIIMPWTDKVRSATVGGYHFDYNHTSYDSFSGPDGTFIVNQNISRPASFADNLGRKTAYTYTNQWGNDVEKLINPDATPSVDAPTGGYTEYEYDSRRNITQIKVYPKGSGTPLVTSATYPTTCANIKTCNRPISITNQAGVTITYTYHPQSGNIATITKPAVNGVQAQIRYKYEQKTPKVRDSFGNLVNSTPVWRLTEISQCMAMTQATCVGTADEQRTVIEYNHNNVLPTSRTIMRGDGSLAQTTTTQYDIFGNVEWVDGPRPGSYDRTYFYYDKLRRVIGEIGVDPDGPGPLPRKAVRTHYHPDGQVSSVKNGIVTSISFNSVDSMAAKTEVQTDYSPANGLPVEERLYADGVLKKVTQKSYDNRWNLECVAERLNPAAFNSLPSDACQLGVPGPDGNDRITRYTYDATNALIKTTSAVGTPRERDDRVNHYRVDNSLLEAEEDGNGNKTFYKYDAYNRPWRTVYPTPGNGSVESTTDYTQNNYNGALVSSVRLRDGQTINFAYDALGRTKTKSGAVSESFAYNNFDQVVSHTNNTTGGSSATSIIQYNSLGWKESETTAHGTVDYDYDAYGRRTRLTWPDNFYITYDYLVSGYPSDQLQHIKEYGTATLASFSYDELGRRDTLTRGNGVVTDYEYDELSRLELFATDVGGGDVDDITETFTYTIAGQLKSRTLITENGAYNYLPVSGQANSYGVNALNQITSNNGATIGYDARGNLISESGNSYTYNANNLLTSAVMSGASSTLTYDAENRLYSISKSGTTTRFMYDGLDLIAETNTSGTVLRRYVHGPAIDDPVVWYEGSGTSTKRYYHENHQGSIIGITQQSGASYAINAYDEYGNQAAGNVGRFQYTGQVWLPEVGLYYYKARLYHPELGRFMQTDPVGYEDQMNLYAYVHNDPLSFTDPSGKVSLPAALVVVAGLAYYGYKAYTGKKALEKAVDKSSDLRNLKQQEQANIDALINGEPVPNPDVYENMGEAGVEVAEALIDAGLSAPPGTTLTGTPVDPTKASEVGAAIATEILVNVAGDTGDSNQNSGNGDAMNSEQRTCQNRNECR